MNESGKQRRRINFKGCKYRITKRGISVITLDLIILAVMFPTFLSRQGNLWERAWERHWYEVEARKTVIKECQILEINEKYSPTNRYEVPVYEVTLKEGNSSPFKRIFNECPGKRGDRIKSEVSKRNYLGEKPEYNFPNEDGSTAEWPLEFDFLIRSLLAVCLSLMWILVGIFMMNESEGNIFEKYLMNTKTGKGSDDGVGILMLFFPSILMLAWGIISWLLIAAIL